MTLSKDTLEHLGAVHPATREQQRRAVCTVLDRLGNGPDARNVLAALLQPPRPTALVSETRTPESVRRHEYRADVRQWAIENDVPLGKGNYVTRAAQARYDRAQAGGEP